MLICFPTQKLLKVFSLEPRFWKVALRKLKFRHKGLNSKSRKLSKDTGINTLLSFHYESWLIAFVSLTLQSANRGFSLPHANFVSRSNP
jgi:hypothetical protein